MCLSGCHHNGFVATHAVAHMMNAHLAFVRFEHSVCRGSPMTTYMVFATEGSFEIAIESYPEWDLNPRPLNSV